MGYSALQMKMKELFISLQMEGRTFPCTYKSRLYYGVARKEEIPQEYPQKNLRAFGSYTEKNIAPVIFVVEGRHPKEFDDNPLEFHDIAAYFTYRNAVHGKGSIQHGIRDATLDTFKAIKDPAILEKYTMHWMRENENILPKIPESDKELLREKLPDMSRKILQENGYL